ncbi:hypothetical protein KX928_23635 [Roseobacter sp. YSTF-M11]|uniref:Uncharacterized protein n=1 Tax=Roseobacter insulae TaxID=2859783 RepID=A0A9X1G0Q8_9RHOB|nr:hypothetical protein [Roseobacter insulae]MBW4710794.1 hypothetical protein [Roseobacter insulae]
MTLVAVHFDPALFKTLICFSKISVLKKQDIHLRKALWADFRNLMMIPPIPCLYNVLSIPQIPAYRTAILQTGLDLS